MDFTAQPLTPTQARVLATLMEKARTVPDSYPLSLNSLQLGCNQKTARDPVMNLSEAEVAQALDELRERSLVVEVSGARVARFEHNVQRAVGVPEQSAALLGLLVLRGPQTAAELRLNTERWYKFLDVASVEAFLDELQERSADKGGPLVQKLPKAPGAREARWAHRLCGELSAEAMASTSASPSASPSDDGQVAMLEARVSELERQLAELKAALGPG
jgi:uncharacterized protein YceH (UPF0502 family)